jgi:hypothetical protein
MIEGNVTFSDGITKELDTIRKQLKTFPAEATAEFIKLTPIRSGNARRKTKLQGDTIVANYDYAKRLDTGWSKQAPDGMSEPLNKWVKNKINKIFRK